MNAEYIQNLRYKLQKRVRKLNSTDREELFHFALQRFWRFLVDVPLFVGIMDELAARCPEMETAVEPIYEKDTGTLGDTEIEHAALAYFVIKHCVQFDDRRLEDVIGGVFNRSDGLEAFKDIFLEPFYEYLDEQLDDQRMVLALLRRYKHKCEWFQSENLYQMWGSDTVRGEKRLAFHLYEYLHDQGINFNIEPTSAVGEADLVSAQDTDDPLIADAKIFNPDKSQGKSYIAKGFNQIYLYTLIYNEPIGYLVIFNTSGKDLKFAVREHTQSTPFVVHNNKTIFIIVIDIYPYEVSASKRGVIETIEITEQDLIRYVEENPVTD